MVRTKASSKQGKLLLPAKLQPQPQKIAPSLSELPISMEQSRKALTALLSHLKNKPESSNLLETEEWVELVVTLKKMPPRERHMPYCLPVPHPLMDPKKAGVCLFVKDPSEHCKKLLTEAKITFIKKVIGVEKLKGKYKSFEARRQLMDTYAIFLADDRIIPTLPKILGKQWLTRKRQPLPVSLKPKSVKANLETALSSTSLFIPAGTSTNVRVGSVESHTADQLMANLEAILPQVAIRVPEGWENVQSLHLKTSTSTALPLWNSNMPLIAPVAVAEESDAEDLEVLPEMEDANDAEIEEAIQTSEKALKAKDRTAPLERKRISAGGSKKSGKKGSSSPAKKSKRKASS